jgi:hypothetical protein
MSDIGVAKTEKQETWYSWHRLPLAPQWSFRKEDEYNTSGFHFHWLIFRAWTSDAPMLGASIDLAESGCFQIRINLPYLWCGIFIPYYPAWRNRFWRKPKKQRDAIKAEKLTKKIIARVGRKI